ncbi:MAG TPA: ankyrin repeat domain-containing protein [Candidatus Acidoferrales bacterium]
MSKVQEFFGAVRAGDSAAVSGLLAADPSLGAARNEQGQSAILFAVYNGRNEIRDLLLARGVPLDLFDAAAAGQLVRVKELVEKDRALANSFSSDGFPVFALAAVFNQRAVAEYLLSRGADVNSISRNSAGYTALTGAVAFGHKDVVSWLLSHGANVHHRYGPGYTPLHEAASSGRLEIVRMLLGAGADPAARTNDGKTPLSFAEERGQAEVAALLRQKL